MAVLNLGVLLALALSLSESAASVSAPVWVGDGCELLDWSPWCLDQSRRRRDLADTVGGDLVEEMEQMTELN